MLLLRGQRARPRCRRRCLHPDLRGGRRRGHWPPGRRGHRVLGVRRRVGWVASKVKGAHVDASSVFAICCSLLSLSLFLSFCPSSFFLSCARREGGSQAGWLRARGEQAKAALSVRAPHSRTHSLALLGSVGQGGVGLPQPAAKTQEERKIALLHHYGFST